jgi:hypothetical protein
MHGDHDESCLSLYYKLQACGGAGTIYLIYVLYDVVKAYTSINPVPTDIRTTRPVKHVLQPICRRCDAAPECVAGLLPAVPLTLLVGDG